MIKLNDTVYVVVASQQSLAGEWQDAEVGRFSSEEKARECVQLCSQEMTEDDSLIEFESEDEDNAVIFIPQKTSKITFEIMPINYYPLDTFSLNDKEYDFR